MNGNIQFMHYRSALAGGTRGGATVAILPNYKDNTAMISIARCNIADVFCKKTGRTIAAGRIYAALNGRASLANKVYVMPIADPMQLKTSVANLVKDQMAAAFLE